MWGAGSTSPRPSWLVGRSIPPPNGVTRWGSAFSKSPRSRQPVGRAVEIRPFFARAAMDLAVDPTSPIAASADDLVRRRTGIRFRLCTAAPPTRAGLGGRILTPTGYCRRTASRGRGFVGTSAGNTSSPQLPQDEQHQDPQHHIDADPHDVAAVVVGLHQAQVFFDGGGYLLVRPFPGTSALAMELALKSPAARTRIEIEDDIRRSPRPLDRRNPVSDTSTLSPGSP